MFQKDYGLVLKLVFTVLLQFVLCSISSGQVAVLLLLFGDKLASEELHLSVDGALNFSNISQLEEGSILGGVNFGLGLHVKLGDHWQLNPQFRPLSQKGTRNTIPLVALPSDFAAKRTNLKLNYLEFPLMVRYSFSPHMFVAAGPQISFLSSAHQVSQGTYTDGADADFRVDIQNYFNKINFSFPVELGYWISIRNRKSKSEANMNLFARYCPGISSMFDSGYRESQSKLTVFQVGISMPFIRNEKSVEEKYELHSY